VGRIIAAERSTAHDREQPPDGKEKQPGGNAEAAME
jgi:hypothetical protein